MASEKKQKKNQFSFLGIGIYMIGLWFVCFEIIYLFVDENNRGTFGDQFGFTNSIFSGLALVGVVYSIILQQKELKETREEFESQNFQTTFFNLLKTQQQIANEISTSISYLKTYKKKSVFSIEGRRFFIQSKEELGKVTIALESNIYSQYTPYDPDMMYEPTSQEEEERLYKSLSLSYINSYYNITKENWEKYKAMTSPLDKTKLVYAVFFNKHSHVIGHYFRHLYHIFKFVDNHIEEKSDKDDKIEIEKFTDFIQAQMSIHELFLLYYNSIAFPKFQALLIKYNIFENLNKESLLDSSHIIDGANLKSNKNLLKF